MTHQKPASFIRSSGVLMHISSLPGDYGIGTFGKKAMDFVDFLSTAGCTYWQTLPFGPIDSYNSPYQSFSAFAGNPFFIDPELLQTQGLITREELENARYNGSPWSSAFEWLRETRIPLFRKAYARCTPEIKTAMSEFCDQQAHWLPDYALYLAIQSSEEGRDWIDWENKDLKNRQPAAIKKAQEHYTEEIQFQIFLQYQFHSQWMTIKEYANKKGIQIIGDIPIYVALQSADVWKHQSCFDLDENGHPNHVAGVPPDYFCTDGQLWGNPLYNWEAMAKNHYQWWMRRLEHALWLFDTVRIDHFRAFSAYWSVPGDAETARNGEWLPGPSMKFFDEVFKQFDFSKPRIIAEDLGVVDDGVRTLLEDTGFPGMRVMQFAFIEDGDNIHYPHNYASNTVAYTGTHDNDTLLGYLWELAPGQRDYAFDYINYPCLDEAWQQGGSDSPSCHAFIRCLWQSPAKVAIVPIQDLCGYGGDTKMNRPGRAEGNWTFRTTEESLQSIDTDWLRELNRIYKR
ncbi:MAG: 4-alpha-glucanotransferase [Eubacteriaceae bacterium]|nr:4-alpha-glucanotransferase [Eubacteriaceae bacterium]MDD4507634.1 4-alpha-glucanotransferase [Eubacteriaceae bacterium]